MYCNIRNKCMQALLAYFYMFFWTLNVIECRTGLDLILVSSNETFTTTCFIICSQLTAIGHKHVTVSSGQSGCQTSWRDISSFHKMRRNKFVTLHHNIHIQQSRKSWYVSVFSGWKDIRIALKGNANCSSGNTHDGKPKGCHSLYICFAQKNTNSVIFTL